MRTIEYPVNATPKAWGQMHGEMFATLIGEIVDIRMDLTVELGAFSDRDAVLVSAQAHLPVLKEFHEDLHDELIGIAEGSGRTPAEIVLLNHYTDLRDIDSGCSALLLRTPAGSMLAQTWDMHGSAAPYVIMMHVPATERRPEAWLFSLVGCLGMTGMNGVGLGITINNLRSTDARVGVVWPALVRSVLQQETAPEGRDVILESKLGSGHHYLVARNRNAFGIETSGEKRKVVFDSRDGVYIHTNHCIDEELAASSTVPETSTTFARYKTLTETLMKSTLPTSSHSVWRLLGVVDQKPDPANPHASATCGGVLMDLAKRRLWGAAGNISGVEPEAFLFEGQEPLE